MLSSVSQVTVNALNSDTDRLQRISLFTEELVGAGLRAAGAASFGAFTSGTRICLPHVPYAVALVITGLAVALVDTGVFVQNLRMQRWSLSLLQCTEDS